MKKTKHLVDKVADHLECAEGYSAALAIDALIDEKIVDATKSIMADIKELELRFLKK